MFTVLPVRRFSGRINGKHKKENPLSTLRLRGEYYIRMLNNCCRISNPKPAPPGQLSLLLARTSLIPVIIYTPHGLNLN